MVVDEVSAGLSVDFGAAVDVGAGVLNCVILVLVEDKMVSVSTVFLLTSFVSTAIIFFFGIFLRILLMILRFFGCDLSPTKVLFEADS